MASLSGARPSSGSRRYWCNLVPTDVSKTMALRVLVGYAARVAAELDRSIEPLTYSISSYFARVFYRVRKGARRADSMLSKSMGYLKYCSVCGFREFSHQIEEVKCSVCGSRVSYVGPLWIDGLTDRELVEKSKGVLEAFTYMSTINQLAKMLACQAAEVSDKPLVPYDVVQLSSKLKVNSPRVEKVVECLKLLGCRAARHCGTTTTIGTDCSYRDVVSCIKQLTSK
ncbi:MAG: hypothetical protein NZ925_04725, partial [Sulfolobales archaeon]|nr:hypothetical protein [Sulfolobales archaeon]